MIKITPTRWINETHILFLEIEASKTKEGIHRTAFKVTLIGGKQIEVTEADAINKLTAADSIIQVKQQAEAVIKELIQPPKEEISNEEILRNSAEKYRVLKSFDVANDPSIHLEAGTPLIRTLVNGIYKFVDTKRPDEIIFDFNMITRKESSEFFAPDELPRIIVTPKVENPNLN